MGIVLGILIAGAILLIAVPPRGQPLVLTSPTQVSSIMVYVTGAVKNPGVYTIARQSRVNDAIMAAGGFIETADLTAVNLAAKIEDGAKVNVPIIGRTGEGNRTPGDIALDPNSTPDVTPTVVYPININSAPQSLLEQLPGIGETKAAAIITYRQEHGSFKRIEDIQNVPGIGSGLYNAIKGLISIEKLP